MRAPPLLSALVPLALASAPLAAQRVAPAAATTTADDPRAVVHAATRAVQGDSAAPLRDRWAARLARDSADRAAALGLATIARLTYDYDRADSLYRRLFADSLHPDRLSALAHLGLARQLERRGFGALAPTQFEIARELAHASGDPTTEGEALVFLAFVRGRTGGPAVGEAALDTAARLLPDTAFGVRALMGNRRAVLLMLRGQADASLAAAESSLALARRSGDPGVEADCYRALGQLLVQQQKFDSGLVVLRRAAERYARARDRGALAANLVWSAQALASLGRYGEMRELMRRALRDGEAAHNPTAVATAYRSLGALDILMGDFAAASAKLRQALAISKETGNKLGEMGTLKFLADLALAAGDTAEARRITLEELAYAQQMGDPLEQHDAHRLLASIAIRGRDWPAAERALADARADISASAGNDRRTWLRFDEGRLAHARGDLAAAERAFTLFLSGLTAVQGTGETEFDVRLRLADIDVARGDLAAAEREMALGSEELDRWRAGLGDAELRVLAFQVNPSEHAAAADPLERDARVARVLGTLAAAGRVEAAFALAERRRARELRDQLARAAGLRVDTAGVSAAAADTSRAPTSAAAALTGAADVAAAIPDDRTALLEFVGGVAGAPTTVFVVRRGAPARAHVLPAADSLGDRVARFAALLEAGTAADGLARSLGTALLDPALADLGGGVARLVIVPDGPLHAVPWDALRLGDGRYVVERYAVSVAPSASVVATLWRRARERAAPAAAPPVRLLAFGDPAFPGERAGGGRLDSATSAAAETYRSAFDSSGGLPRLRASADEARRVARYAPEAEVRLRERASAAFLKSAPLGSFRIIHFATHALVDEHTGARTALALAPGGGESGFVGAGDLAALPLDADLVVLSACRSARGRIVEGEGVQGLTAPLLQAGAHAVVATGWRIGDRATVAFMDDFYAALARGLPVTDALRAAKLDAIRRGAPPREWAAFTTVGDPLVAIPLRTPAATIPRWALVLAISLAVLALVAMVLTSRRRRAVRAARA